jgi:hypothetical protein
MAVQEFKTWIFRCDRCNYTETIKAVHCPDVPQKGWTLEGSRPYDGFQPIKHYCVSCTKKFYESSLLNIDNTQQ